MKKYFAEPIDIISDDNVFNIDLRGKKAIDGGIPVISDGEVLYCAGGDSNSMTVSDPGGGKSSAVAYTVILSCATAEHTIIVHDCKGELYAWTKGFLESLDYKIKVLNFRRPLTQQQYNPLYYPAYLYKNGDKDRGLELVNNLATSIYTKVKSEKDRFWDIMSANYFVALFLLAINLTDNPEEVTLKQIYHLFVIGNIKKGGSTILKQYLEMEGVSDELREAFEGIVTAPSDTKASIDAVFTSMLSRLIVNNQITDMISGHSIEFDDLENEKTAIFLVTRDESTTYNAVVSAFFDQVYEFLVERATQNGGVLDRICDFVLDEFSNMAKINDFAVKISTCRSRGIRMHLFLQSLNQLESVYENDAATIMDCAQNWLYLHSPEPKMNKVFAERLGMYISGYTGAKNYLIEPAELQYLKKWQAVLLIGRQRPFVTMLSNKWVMEKAFDIPAALPESNVERKKKKIKSIDLEKIVSDYRDKKIKSLVRSSTMK